MANEAWTDSSLVQVTELGDGKYGLTLGPETQAALDWMAVDDNERPLDKVAHVVTNGILNAIDTAGKDLVNMESLALLGGERRPKPTELPKLIQQAVSDERQRRTEQHPTLSRLVERHPSV